MLAEKLGFSVKQAKARISSAEFTGWLALHRLREIEEHERTSGHAFQWERWLALPSDVTMGKK